MGDDTRSEQVERRGKGMKLRADIVLEEMAELFRERNIKYGDNWEKVGHMFMTLFPNGIEIKTSNDFIKFHFLGWVFGKFSRWVNNGLDGSDDSLRDAVVYMAMIQAFAQLVEKDDESKGNSKPIVSGKTESSSREQAMADPVVGSTDRRR